MIKLFRKARQRLLADNKFGKYLIYAIGEILLVVIGILIALQIDNWNDTQKQIKKEKEILEQFAVELNEDLQILDNIISNYDFIIKSCDTLLVYLEQDLPYKQALAIYFDKWSNLDVLEFNVSAYQNLITIGPELIENKVVRNDLLRLYNLSYKKARTYNDYYRSDFHSFIAPIQLENVKAVKWGKSSVPIDYEELKKNVLFLNALKWSKNAHQANNQEFRKLRGYIVELMTLIKEELKSIKFG